MLRQVRNVMVDNSEPTWPEKDRRVSKEDRRSKERRGKYDRRQSGEPNNDSENKEEDDS